MKKITVFLSGLLLAATASANYGYLCFYTDSASEPDAIGLQNLTITIEGERLIASNLTESLTFSLSELSAMRFSDDFLSVSPIISDKDGKLSFYTLNGVYAGEFDSLENAAATLDAGIYILKTASDKSIKILIGK